VSCSATWGPTRDNQQSSHLNIVHWFAASGFRTCDRPNCLGVAPPREECGWQPYRHSDWGYGAIQTILGHIDLALEAGDVGNPDRIVAAAASFVADNNDFFLPTCRSGIPATFRYSRSYSFDDTLIIEIEQYASQYKLASSQIILGVDPLAGTLTSLSGGIRCALAPDGEPQISPKDLSAYLPRGSSDTVTSYEVLMDAHTGHFVWDVQTDSSSFRLDDRTRSPLFISNGDGAVYRTCSFDYDDFARDSSGRTIDVTDSTGALLARSEACEGDEVWFTSNCDFKMRDTQHDQPLNQILDGSNGPGTNTAQNYIRTLACSTTTPAFTSTSLNSKEQREAWVWLKQAARTARLRFFDLEPAASAAVTLHTDWDGGQVAMGASARYDDSSKKIYFNNGSVRADLVWHEYGHHVANMYGDFDDTPCVYQVDNSDALDEAVAAAFSMVTLSTGGFYPTYGAMNQMGVGLPGPHSASRGPTTFSSALCTGNALYPNARPFAQAFWEVLSNRNCSIQTCNESVGQYASSGGVISGVAESTFENHIAHSLAYALRITPSNTSFGSIVSSMTYKWITPFGVIGASDLRAIFSHHGL
jgi:hypothetical protein